MRNPNAHWRDSARIPRFYIMSAYAIFPLLFFVLHIRWWTFFLCLFAIIFFSILERFGFTIPIFLRWLKNFIGGTRKMARHWWRPL